jgi:hypothetical protein
LGRRRLFYDASQEGPATHALVIGVGGYDHLRGGASTRKLQRATRFGNLGQLTSPPRSAVAFARFLTSRPHDWLAPLSTVDLLISTGPGDKLERTVGRSAPATRDSIQTAFDSWWERCDTHPENVAIFYFCGHGLQATNQVLLASDFGATGNPWAQAFDLNKTRQAFTANRARTQVFLIDACREVTTSNVEVPDPSAPPLREPEMRQPENCEHDLTIQATSRTKKAHGYEGDVSYFTKAVLHALAGGAAKARNGEWWVRSDLIAGNIKQLIELAGGTDPRPVAATSSATQLYRLPGAPDVRLEFGCNPAAATRAADLACWQPPAGSRQARPTRNAKPWRLCVPAGIYQLEASFPDRSFQDAIDLFSVEPPVTNESLPVQ